MTHRQIRRFFLITFRFLPWIYVFLMDYAWLRLGNLIEINIFIITFHIKRGFTEIIWVCLLGNITVFEDFCESFLFA